MAHSLDKQHVARGVKIDIWQERFKHMAYGTQLKDATRGTQSKGIKYGTQFSYATRGT
jgi:hypothetical protein